MGKKNQEVPGFKVKIVFPITPIHLLRQVVVPAPGSSLMPRFLSGQDDHGGSGTAGAAEEIVSKSISDPQGLRGPVLLIWATECSPIRSAATWQWKSLGIL